MQSSQRSTLDALGVWGASAYETVMEGIAVGFEPTCSPDALFLARESFITKTAIERGWDEATTASFRAAVLELEALPGTPVLLH